MGLPIDRLICASNANKVLYDFFETGTYDKNRQFFLTSSPSMDILVSSNLERYLYDVLGDAEKVKTLMTGLKINGKYQTAADHTVILGEYADETETLAAVKTAFDRGYLMDPHTAVALCAHEKYAAANPGDTKQNVIVSTASPYKFADAVLKAVTGQTAGGGVSALLETLSAATKTEIPRQIRDITKKEIRHQIVCEKEAMAEEIMKFLER
jgi:threonine synthase